MTDRHWFTRVAVPAFGLSTIDVAVFKVLEDRADAEGECYPGRKRIASESGASLRSVARALATLSACGLVTIVGPTLRRNSRYRLASECPPLPEPERHPNAGARVRGPQGHTNAQARARSGANESPEEGHTGTLTRPQGHTKIDRKNPSKGVLPVGRTEDRARDAASAPLADASALPQPQERSEVEADGERAALLLSLLRRSNLRQVAAQWAAVLSNEPRPTLGDVRQLVPEWVEDGEDLDQWINYQLRRDAIDRAMDAGLCPDVWKTLADSVRAVLDANRVRRECPEVDTAAVTHDGRASAGPAHDTTPKPVTEQTR